MARSLLMHFAVCITRLPFAIARTLKTYSTPSAYTHCRALAAANLVAYRTVYILIYTRFVCGIQMRGYEDMGAVIPGYYLSDAEELRDRGR